MKEISFWILVSVCKCVNGYQIPSQPILTTSLEEVKELIFAPLPDALSDGFKFETVMCEDGSCFAKSYQYTLDPETGDWSSPTESMWHYVVHAEPADQ